jgi:hypothetical protein
LYVTQRLGVALSVFGVFPYSQRGCHAGLHDRHTTSPGLPSNSEFPCGSDFFFILAMGLIAIDIAPVGSLVMIVIYVYVVAVASALISPRKDALIQLNIDPKQRARSIP